MATGGKRPFTQMTIGLSLEGSQFSQTLKNINQQVKLAESNMKANLKILGNAEKSYDDLKKVLKDVQGTYDAQEKKMKALNKAYEEAVEQYGENSAEARKYGVQINNLAGTMAVLDRQLKATNREMVYMEEGIEDTKKAMAKANKETEDMVKAYKAAGRQVEALAEEQKGYVRQMEQTEDLMKKQQKVIQRMTDEYGENSKEVEKAKRSYQNLGRELRQLEIRLEGTTDKLTEMGVEGVEAQRNLQREMARTEGEIRDLERAMNGMDRSSQAFQQAERRAQQLREELNRGEQEAEQFQNSLRQVGNQRIDTTNIDKVGDRLDGLSNKAGLAGAAIAGALGAVSAGVLSQIDQAIEKIGTLANGVKDYENSLRQGVRDSSYSRQANIYGIEGSGGVSGAKVLENIGQMTGFDAPEVGKAMNLLMKQFGMTQKMAQDTLIRASRQGLTELDEVVEYLGAQETSNLDTKAKQDLANFMINGATKAIQAGGARNTDNALDFYNEVFVRALDKNNKTIRDQWSEAGGKDALKAMDQFAKDGDVSALMKNLDKAVVSKWGNDEVAQRSAWQQISGTQTELVNMDGIKQLVNGDKPMKVQMFDANGKPVLDAAGNPTYKNVDGKISTQDQELLDAQNRFDKVVGSWKATMLNFSAELVPILEPIMKDLTQWLEKHGATVAKNLSDFIAGFVGFFQGLFGTIAKIQEKIEGEANWKRLGEFAGVLATVALSFKALSPLFKLLSGSLKFLKDVGAWGAVQTGVGKAWGAAKRGAFKAGSKTRDIWDKFRGGGGGGGRPMGIIPGDPVARERRTQMAINAREATKRGVGKVANVAKGAVGTVGKLGKGVAGVGRMAMGALGGPVGLILTALPLVISGFKALYNNSEGFRNFIDGIVNKVKELWAFVKPYLIDAWDAFKVKVSELWTTVKPILEKLWDVVKTVFTGIWNAIKPVLEWVWNAVKTYVGFVWNFWKTVFTTIWNLVKTVFTGIWNAISPVLTWVWNAVKTYIGFVWNFWSTIFGKVWDIVKTVFTNVKDWIGSAFTWIKEKAVGFKDNFVETFTSIKDGVVEKITNIIDTVKSLPGRIADGLKNGASALKDAGAKMINGLVDAVEGGINKVIGGINTALGWFGITKKISEVKFGRMDVSNAKSSVKRGTGGYVPQYHKGTKPGGHKGGLAIVNDAKGSTYRELIELPNGEMFIPKGRNLMLDLPKGTQILDARKTKKVAGTGHIPAYASGTKGAWDWTKEKVMGGINWVAEKIKSLADVRKKIVDYVAKKIGFNEDTLSGKMVKGLGNKLIDSAASLVFGGKKHLDHSETGGMSGGMYTGDGKSSGGLANLVNIVRNIISKYPGSRITSTLRPGARTETGALSDHALGKAVDVGGHGYNGSPKYKAIAEDFMKLPIGKYAIANNMWTWKNRFGWKKYPYGGHMNHVHLSAFRRGGFVNKPTFGMVGEDGTEAVIPMSKALRTRGLGLLHETANAMGYEVEEKNAAQQHNNELMMALIAEVQALREEVKKKDTNVYMDGRKVGQGVKVHEKTENIKVNIARGK